MKNSQKGFVLPLLLIIIAALLVAGGAYVYVQNKQTNQMSDVTLPDQTTPTAQTSNTQTADWKTYTNSQYSFSFQYPANLEFNSYESSPGVFTFQVSKTKTPTRIECNTEFSFSGSVFDKKIVSTSIVSDTVKRQYNDSLSYTQENIGGKVVMVEKKTLGVCGSGDIITWTEPSGRFVVLFNLQPSEVDLSSDYKNTYNQILSTFKFNP